MDHRLSKIDSPRDLSGMSNADLAALAEEMREALCNLISQRSAHFSSNLGVIELCLALHSTFDFSRDRLIWDTGHQIYPHKMITGRYHEFGTIRTRSGLMGYPNPQESPFDLFMTGHAGCSVSAALGLRCGDDLLRPAEGRQSVAVIGDGAFVSGIVFEAMNNAGGLKRKLLVVLNDNKMSICPRTGGLADMFDRMRTTKFYGGLKSEIVHLLDKMPLVGAPVERVLNNFKEAVKAGLHGGMLFEELGFHYIGPIDGHNIRQLRKYLAKVQKLKGPVLLHVVTEKGHGFRPAAEDPVYFHTPAPFVRANGQAVPLKTGASSQAYTHTASAAVEAAMAKNSRVVVMTAAMCQGTNLEKVRTRFPDRFFDTGICEEHSVAFAAGLAKAGLRPIVDIYSTFLQRAYDQIFQEVALQDLPVTFLLDRAGVTGPDGPTHHGMFDLGYMRLFPNMVVMAPGDAEDLRQMLAWALEHNGPASIRFPKANAETISAVREPIALGRAEALRSGRAGTMIACGTLLSECLKAAQILAEEGLDFGVINARFVKPLDTEMLLQAIRQSPLVVTVEEATLMGGFGSAVLEMCSEAGVSASHVRRLGVPDRFVEHADRNELLSILGLDAEGIANVCRKYSVAADPVCETGA